MRLLRTTQEDLSHRTNDNLRTFIFKLNLLELIPCYKFKLIINRYY